MTPDRWQKIADKLQDGCSRLSRALIVGHIGAVVFILIALQIPDFPVWPVYNLQFLLLCLNTALVGSIGAVNYMFTWFAIKQIGESNGSNKEPPESRT